MDGGPVIGPEEAWFRHMASHHEVRRARARAWRAVATGCALVMLAAVALARWC